jgi:hypothetical protein
MTTGHISPVSFLVETTKETVLITVNSVSPSGVFPLFATAPTTTLTINGVLSNPSPPSIANSLSVTPTGYQFQFNYIAGLAADVIMGYNIYKNSINSFPGAGTFIKAVSQPSNLTADPSATGIYTYQETVPLGTTAYYWVTSVNQIGLESSPEFAGTTTAVTPIDASGNLLFKNIGSFSGGGGGFGSAGVYVRIGGVGSAITVTTNGHPVLLIFSGYINGMTVAGSSVILSFTRTVGSSSGNNQIGEPVELITSLTVSSNAYPVALSYIDMPAAGTYTYAVYGAKSSNSSAASVQVMNFQVVEFA